jgi:hypothetical protein
MSVTDVSDGQGCQDNGLHDVSDTGSVSSTEASLPDVTMSPVSSFSLGSSSMPPAVKVRKWRTVTPADPALQRVTRSVSSGKGFRAAPIKELQPRPMKRTRKVQSSSVVALLCVGVRMDRSHLTRRRTSLTQRRRRWCQSL